MAASSSHKSRSARFRYWIRPFPKRLIMVYGISFAGRRLPCGIGTVEGTGELPPRELCQIIIPQEGRGFKVFVPGFSVREQGDFPAAGEKEAFGLY